MIISGQRLISILDESPSEFKDHICIIGAGLVGLFVAHRLRSLGQKVLVFEAGGYIARDGFSLDEELALSSNYGGLVSGRATGLGGTSNVWGGALLPYLPSDMEPHNLGWHGGWSVDWKRLDHYRSEIESLFGVDHSSYELYRVDTPAVNGWKIRFPKWPSFKRRSTKRIFSKLILSDADCIISLNSGVSGFVHDRKNEVNGVIIQMTGAAKPLVVRCSSVMIAAGAIESTKLLLKMLGGIDNYPKALESLGNNFHDHISAPICELIIKNPNEFFKIFSLRFEKGFYRNVRYELSAESRNEKGLPAAFAHIAFDRSSSGFDGLRGILQAVQKREVPHFNDLKLVFSDFSWILKVVLNLAIYRRLLSPPGARFFVHLVLEQSPSEAGSVKLVKNETDAEAVETELKWTVSDSDKLNFVNASKLFIESWNTGEAGKLASAVPLVDYRIDSNSALGVGIYHPAGSSPMHRDVSSAIIDAEQRVVGVSGLWSVSSANLPSVGGSSPSLCLVQLGYLAADSIVSSLSSSS